MHAFVTGFPGFIGKRLVQFLVKAQPDLRLTVLVLAKEVRAAQAEIDSLKSRNTIEVLTGDVADMHLGLAGHEYQRLADSVTHVFHLAAVSTLNLARDVAFRVNVDGVRNVLELASESPKLQRVVHFSSCYVSGDRVGVIAEDELEEGQSFRNAYEESKYEGERLMQRAQKRLPITILRPATVVGDSKTGQIDRFEGPYYLAMLLVLSPLVLPLPLPGNGVAPLNVVPVDFVIRATWELTRNPEAKGKTVHLVDPNPMSARRVYELIAARSNKKLPRFSLPAKVTDLFMRLPGLESRVRPQRAAISYVNHLALYNCRTALELLEGTDVRCPSLESYLDTLIDYAVDTWRAKKVADEEDVDDPLDGPAK